jgi:hypothetical protein
MKGKILLRNDSVIMIDPQMYIDMISRFDERILTHFGGGIHSCGKIEKIVARYIELPSIQCVDFGQSELNDVSRVYATVSKKKIPLLRIMATENELLSGAIASKYPTGANIVFRANSLEHAKAVISAYKGLF